MKKPKKPTPIADAYEHECRGVGLRPDDAIPIIRKLERERDELREEREIYRRERDIAITRLWDEISSLLHVCDVNGLRDHGAVKRIAANYPQQEG